MRFLAALSLLLLSWPLLAGDVVYRWKDRDGQLHYSETPPASGAYERIEKSRTAAPPAAPAAAPDTKAFLERADAENKAAAEAKAKEKQAKTEAVQKCADARDRLNFLVERTPRRLALENSDGSYSRMDEDQFEKRRAAAQADVDKTCS